MFTRLCSLLMGPLLALVHGPHMGVDVRAFLMPALPAAPIIAFAWTQRRCSERLKVALATVAARDRERQRLLLMLSHELRNPIQVIGLRLKMAAPSVGTLRSAQQAVAQITRMAEDLTAIAEMSEPGLPVRRGVVDLRQLLRDACPGWDERAEAAGLRFCEQLPEEPVYVMGDALRLLQVFDNLVNNALKFTDEGGLWLSLTDGEGICTVRVEDSGVGFPPEDRGRIWEPFERGSASRGRRRGLGVGLAIVKQLVDRHGGTIHGWSAGRGQGAIFTVTLPAALDLEGSDTPSP
jgi:signal transduction histidine kinase